MLSAKEKRPVDNMTGSKFLPILMILVSGFIICISVPRFKKAANKSNGQQLTLISAIAGLIFFVPVYLMLSLFAGGEVAATASNGSDVLSASNRGGDDNSLIGSAAIIVFVLSMAIFVVDYSARKFYSFMLDDSRVRQKTSSFARKNINEGLYQSLDSLVQHLHWYSYLYFVYTAKCVFGQDQAESLYLSSMLEQQSGLCMFVMESRKVVIGNVAGMPDPREKKSETCVRVLPYYTGHLCEKHLQLHITTDYTKQIEEQRRGIDHQYYSFDVILPSARITYAREFDLDFFKKRFIRKECLCGHKLYSVGLLQGSKKIGRFQGYRHKENCRSGGT